METRLIKIDEEQIDFRLIEEAGEIIREGGLVAFPTETVYGLGGDALNPVSAEKIYAAKGRPSDNPLIVHIADMEALPRIVKKIPEAAYRLAGRYWPGPLTMIFEKADCIPRQTTGGLETVAVRMPSNGIARELIKAAGGYIAAPSTNRSGRPSPTDARYVREDLDGRVDMIIDGGPARVGLESTIIDLTENVPVILRPGYITEEMLEEVLESVNTDEALTEEGSAKPPKAPGMKYRHYAPKGNLVIVEGPAGQVVEYINGKIAGWKKEGKRCGVIATDETAGYYGADSIKSVGKRQDEAQIASRIFRILREFDDEETEMIYTEGFENRGLGRAIMNRLLKAAGHQVVRLPQDADAGTAAENKTEVKI